MLIEIMKKKSVLLEDDASDLLQSWTTAYLLDVKVTEVIIFFSLPGWFSQIINSFFACVFFIFTLVNLIVILYQIILSESITGDIKLNFFYYDLTIL